MPPDPRHEALARETAAAASAGDDVAIERAAWAVVRANPRDHAAWHVLALAAIRAGRAEIAIELADRAHRLDRKNADYLNALGIAYGESGREAEAVAALRRAIKLRPAFADAHYHLGKVFARHERLAEAGEAYRRALAIDPEHLGAKHNLAGTLLRMGESEGALALARETHAAAPDNADLMIRLADALADVSGNPVALDFVRRCLAAKPDEPRLHYWLADVLLGEGEWREGWREYLWRQEAIARRPAPPPPFPEDLEGEAILLLPEQGLGDTLFFLRFVGGIRDRSGKVVLRAPDKLFGLLSDTTGLDQMIAGAAPLPAEVAIRATVLPGDLPWLLGTETVARAFPLRARVDLVQRWRERLAAFGPPPHVGLTWRAGTDLRTTPEFAAPVSRALFKEIDLRSLASGIKGLRATLVSIQRLPAVGETTQLGQLLGQPVHDLSAANDDLVEMTALLAVLDDYIGVSNTNTHVRAGLGLPAKVIVPYPPEYRWMSAGDHSPWFPGFRIYRQAADRRWSEPMKRLRSDLELD